MKKRKGKSLKKRTLKFINTPYVIDRSFVVKIFEEIGDHDRIIFDFKNVEFFSRAASHEFLTLRNSKSITLINFKHLLLAEENKILNFRKTTNSFHVVEDKNFENYRNSLSEINYY